MEEGETEDSSTLWYILNGEFTSTRSLAALPNPFFRKYHTLVFMTGLCRISHSCRSKPSQLEYFCALGRRLCDDNFAACHVAV